MRSSRWRRVSSQAVPGQAILLLAMDEGVLVKGHDKTSLLYKAFRKDLKTVKY